ncbi:DUF4062 domain-containing protein [Stutzerimonas nitrititolerans]|uniref:DUF4062 domain-containing protein n=1 Tax=Stutzerimonas nitrititolerans TaxID=2482751 RepID=UPI00289636DA|nr:DUF4062 domain-containing protein [Stutzerimonas nitrititolerans]
MANLRVFISSTCFDLSVTRGQLRAFIEDLGFQPVMSDYNDVLFDPRVHTHTSCINEVSSCDMVLVLVGSRFGGRAVPAAVAQLDFDSLQDASKSIELLKEKNSISITQMEVLHAIQSSIPVFTFVDERVWNDHATYEKNKDKEIASQIEYASIEKADTAKYVFEFINFLRLRSINNSISTYHRYSDIEEALRKQWSSLFQRLLSEERSRSENARRIDDLTEQFEDLKTAILTAIGSGNEREVARGVVRYRRLLDFLGYVSKSNPALFLTGTKPWKQFLDDIGVVGVASFNRSSDFNHGRFTEALILKDQTFFALRNIRIHTFENDWEEFVQLAPEVRKIIYEALEEMGSRHPMYVRHINMTVEDYFNKYGREGERIKEVEEAGR